MRLRAWRRHLAVLAALASVAGLAILSPLVPASGAESWTRWAGKDVRVNDPKADFGGRRRGVREPVIAIDPTNPDRMVAALMDKAYSNTHDYGAWGSTIRVYRSTDGGKSWDLTKTLHPPRERKGDEVWTAGDPTLAFDARGRLYLANLATTVALTDDGLLYAPKGGIELYRSTDAGKTWSGPTWASRRIVDYENAHCAGEDKELLGVDPKTGELFLAYTIFYNDCPRTQQDYYLEFATQPVGAEIVVIRSSDGGRSWSRPKQLWDSYALGAQPVVGPDGTIYVAFVGSAPAGSESVCPGALGTVGEKPAPGGFEFVVASSRDDGKTWSYEERLQCEFSYHPSLTPVAAGGIMPSISVDPVDGRVYAVWPGMGNPGYGLYVMTSFDRGESWSETRSMTGISELDFMLPSVHAEGCVARAIFLATPDQGTTFDVLMSESSDGGETWSTPSPVSTASMSGERELGDYMWLDVVRDRVAAVWTDARTGGMTDVYARTGAVKAKPGCSPSRVVQTAASSASNPDPAPARRGKKTISAVDGDRLRAFLRLPDSSALAHRIDSEALAFTTRVERDLEDVFDLYRERARRFGLEVVFADYEGFEAELFISSTSGAYGFIRLDIAPSGGTSIAASFPMARS